MFSNNFICMCFCAKKIAVKLTEALPCESRSHVDFLSSSSLPLFLLFFHYFFWSLDTDWPKETHIPKSALHAEMKRFFINRLSCIAREPPEKVNADS